MAIAHLSLSPMSSFLLPMSSRLLFRSSFSRILLMPQRGSISLVRSASSSSSTNADVPVANPTSDFLANLPAVLGKAKVDGGIPGMSVAILHKGDIVFAQGFGKCNQIDPFTKEVINRNKGHLQ